MIVILKATEYRSGGGMGVDWETQSDMVDGEDYRPGATCGRLRRGLPEIPFAGCKRGRYNADDSVTRRSCECRLQ